MANKRPDTRSRKIVKDRTGRCHDAGGRFTSCEGEGGSAGGGTGEASAPQTSSSSQPTRPLNKERFTQVSRETRHLDPDTRHAHHTAAIKKIEGDAQARATGTRTAPHLSTHEQETIDAHRALLTTVAHQQHKRRTNEIAWRKEEIHNRAKQRGMDKHLTDDDRQSLSEAHATLSTLRTIAQKSPTGELGSEHLQEQRQARTTIAAITQKHARAKPLYTRSERERLRNLDEAEKDPSIPLQSREAATLSQQRRAGERRRLTQAEATAAQRQEPTHHPSHDIPIVGGTTPSVTITDQPQKPKKQVAITDPTPTDTKQALALLEGKKPLSPDHVRALADSRDPAARKVYAQKQREARQALAAGTLTEQQRSLLETVGLVPPRKREAPPDPERTARAAMQFHEERELQRLRRLEAGSGTDQDITEEAQHIRKTEREDDLLDEHGDPASVVPRLAKRKPGAPANLTERETEALVRDVQRVRQHTPSMRSDDDLLHEIRNRPVRVRDQELRQRDPRNVARSGRDPLPPTTKELDRRTRMMAGMADDDDLKEEVRQRRAAGEQTSIEEVKREYDDQHRIDESTIAGKDAGRRRRIQLGMASDDDIQAEVEVRTSAGKPTTHKAVENEVANNAILTRRQMLDDLKTRRAAMRQQQPVAPHEDTMDTRVPNRQEQQAAAATQQAEREQADAERGILKRDSSGRVAQKIRKSKPRGAKSIDEVDTSMIAIAEQTDPSAIAPRASQVNTRHHRRQRSDEAARPATVEIKDSGASPEQIQRQHQEHVRIQETAAREQRETTRTLLKERGSGQGSEAQQLTELIQSGDLSAAEQRAAKNRLAELRSQRQRRQAAEQQRRRQRFDEQQHQAGRESGASAPDWPVRIHRRRAETGKKKSKRVTIKTITGARR